ncbi:hypothetical protein [Micromonospora aurantiaca (nom. illeg.)]|uniref:hypothetical protein n=1 Tax=Micromonospora aurantiaca (nom. illeg.) TaxID=47850 RepID=UPI0037A49BCC
MPDAFGRFYAVLLTEAHEILLTDDDALFAELFPAVSRGAALAFQRLRAEPQKMDPRLAVPAITRPLVELLELSGAALLLTELRGGSDWETVINGWDGLLHGLEDPAATAGIYSVALDAHQPAVLFDRGRMARDSRWRRIAQYLRQQGVATGLSGSGLSRERRAHPSAIVRVMAAGDGLYRLHDLFAVRYLADKLPELELPASARRLQDALEHRKSAAMPRAHPDTDQSSTGMDDEGGERHAHAE